MDLLKKKKIINQFVLGKWAYFAKNELSLNNRITLATKNIFFSGYAIFFKYRSSFLKFQKIFWVHTFSLQIVKPRSFFYPPRFYYKKKRKRKRFKKKKFLFYQRQLPFLLLQTKTSRYDANLKLNFFFFVRYNQLYTVFSQRSFSKLTFFRRPKLKKTIFFLKLFSISGTSRLKTFGVPFLASIFSEALLTNIFYKSSYWHKLLYNHEPLHVNQKLVLLTKLFSKKQITTKKPSLFFSSVIVFQMLSRQVLKRDAIFYIANSKFLLQLYKPIIFQLYKKLPRNLLLFHKFFFPKDFCALLLLTFVTKDLTFFSQWLKQFLERIPFLKHALFLRVLRKFLLQLTIFFQKNCNILGFKLLIKGKISVSGNAKKRRMLINLGQSSKSDKYKQFCFFQNQVRTHTGVLGIKYLLTY